MVESEHQRQHKEKKVMQVLVQSPFSQIPSGFVSINPNHSLRQLFQILGLLDDSSSSYFFSFNGKPLLFSPDPLSSLFSSSSSSVPTLLLHRRVLGGGGDGGATGAESRDCYLNMYAEKKPDKVDPNETRLSKWRSCALSSQPLRPPCVIDRLGNLYNKEVLVESLLSKTLPKALSSHIRGLKDMIPIQLSEIPYNDDGDDDSRYITFKTRFQCPISGLEFNGKYKFYALRPCGHVLSAKALKEIKSSTCLVCHRDFSDKIVINGTPDEVDALREKMEEEDRAKLKDRKDKKSKKIGADAGPPPDAIVGTNHSGLNGKTEALLPATTTGVEVAGLNGGGTEKKKKNNTKLEDEAKGPNASAKRFKAVDMAPSNATKEVYASIFTSSKKSQLKETFTCRSLPLGRN